jgi:putative peptidoglycan lipid II flippase
MKHIARSTLIITVFFGLEKALGFIRNVAIARTFGASTELDTFNAANNIPDLLFALISGGALAMALIPVLSEYLEQKGRPQAWDLFSRIGNLVFLVAAGLSVIVALLADHLVRWNVGIAPGFSPEQQALVADLMRLNLIATMFYAIAGMAIAGLQANQHFFLPALAPSMVDLGMIVGIFILVPETGLRLGPVTLPALGLGIRGLVYGTILGSALFLGIQIPGLIRYQFRWAPKINLHHPGVRQVLVIFGPRVLTVFCIQLIFIATDNIASRLVTGSITALVYGWLFLQVPESLVGTAIGTALLPTISEQTTRGDDQAFLRTMNTGIRVILSVTIPITALVFAGITPLIRILGFDSSGTDLTLWVTRAYVLGLAGHSLLEIAARAFYARQNARIPLLTKFFTLVTFVVLAVLLSRPLSAAGIALSNSIAFTGEALWLLWLLRREYPDLLHVDKTLWRVIPAGAASAGLVFLALKILPLDEMALIPSTVTGFGVLFLGWVLTLPFSWPEIRLLLKLERE